MVGLAVLTIDALAELTAEEAHVVAVAVLFLAVGPPAAAPLAGLLGCGCLGCEGVGLL